MKHTTKKPLAKKPASAKSSVVAKPSKKNKQGLWLKILANANIAAFIAMMIINFQAINLPLGGMTTGALSDLYPNLFTPAGLTFSIRGLIYLTLFGFVIRQMVDLSKKNSLGITKKVGIRFLLSCLANIGRLFARHFQQVFLSVIVMLAFLVILIVLASKVQLGKKLGTRKEKLLVQIPFSVYLGRISVATIANVSARLVHIQRTMRGMTPIFWTIVMIIIAAVLALLALYKKYNVIFALVVIRAFIGIIIKTLGAEIIYSQIVWTLGISIAVIAAAIGRRFEKRIEN